MQDFTKDGTVLKPALFGYLATYNQTTSLQSEFVGFLSKNVTIVETMVLVQEVGWQILELNRMHNDFEVIEAP